MYAAGAVFEGRFFLISSDDEHTSDTMRVYDFHQQEWALWEFAIRPPATKEVFIDEGPVGSIWRSDLVPLLDALPVLPAAYCPSPQQSSRLVQATRLWCVLSMHVPK